MLRLTGRLPWLRNRWLALVILCTASLMIILDGTIVTVALPTIQADLGFTAGSLSWVMNSYLIAFGGLLLLSGRLGDLLGRKRHVPGRHRRVHPRLARLRAGGRPGMLIAARFVQGARRAPWRPPSPSGMIVRLFDPPDEQGRAIGAFAFTGAVGASAGLIARRPARAVRELALDLLREPAGRRCSPGSPAGGCWPRTGASACGPGADVLGALLATSGVMLAVFAIASPADWWAGLIAVALLAGVRRPPGHRADAAAAAARARLPQRVRRQPRAAARHRRGDGLPGDRDPVPAARARLPPRGSRASGLSPTAVVIAVGVARPVGAADRAASAPGRCCWPAWS